MDARGQERGPTTLATSSKGLWDSRGGDHGLVVILTHGKMGLNFRRASDIIFFSKKSEKLREKNYVHASASLWKYIMEE